MANGHFNINKSKVEKYIQQAKSDYPQSPWIENILSLEKKLKKVEIKASHLQFSASNTYTPIRLNTKNAKKLYVQVYKTTNTAKEYKNWEVMYDSVSYKTTIDAPLIYEESIGLRSFDDYKEHNTIYKLNPLEVGNYTIIFANNPDFKNDGEENAVSTSNLIVTDVFLSASLDKETDDFDLYKLLLINRKTGAPHANKQVILYKSINYKAEFIAKLKTDSKGEALYKTSDLNDHVQLDDLELFIPEENQLIDLMELDHIPEHLERGSQEKNDQYGAITMMDRAIYRPGQEIFFKSILYNNHLTKGKVISHKTLSVELYDANRQKIDSLTLTTNNFGSIHGSFKLPNKTLAGSFHVVVKIKNLAYGFHFFQVEEYKRPTFHVKFEKNKNTYTHQDTAIFIGSVESLAGAKLSDASVRYKVNFQDENYRQIQYIDTTAFTDIEGKFNIKVPLMDSTFSELNDFTLRYSAEVTNQSGEMQKGDGQYRFSAKPWKINISSPAFVEEGRWSKLNINTTNQNGDPLKFAGTVNIYKSKQNIKPISNYYIPLFNGVEYHLLSNEEYEKYFPHYFDINTFTNTKKEILASYTFNTSDTSLILLDSSLFKIGKYEIEAISIHGKDSIESSAVTSVYDVKTKKMGNKDFFTYSFDKSSYWLGDKVTLTFYTDVENPINLYLIEVLKEIKQPTKLLNWKNGKIEYTFTLKEEMISPNLVLNTLFVINNQISYQRILVPILKNDKNIHIKTQTFRDKITPGQKEKWCFTIDTKESNLSAEILATMYDSSLDVLNSKSFPSRFESAHSYSYIHLFHLESTFNQGVLSSSSFNKNIPEPSKHNGISTPLTYDLWNHGNKNRFRTSFENDEMVLEEVVVTATGVQRKTALTGSVVTVALQGAIPGVQIQGSASTMQQPEPIYVVDGEIVDKSSFEKLNKLQINSMTVLKDENAIALYGSLAQNGAIVITTKEGAHKERLLDHVQARTNLQETAFFYPTLYTDATGQVSFEFDSPEALTKWKLQLFAHSKTLHVGTATYFTQTQKQLMVRPNLPRYMREGDQIILKAQIQNLSKEIQKGNARIEIIDPETNENVTQKFITDLATIPFEAEASKNTIVEWNIVVPKDYPSVHIKIVAATDEFADGEQQELPILPNRILITDTEKIILQPKESKEYPIATANKDNLQARIQVQSNPILEIISALHYLKQYPYECNEQLVSKWFGLKMLEYISKNYPQISEYFKSIKTEEAEGKLEANVALSELKNEEMPCLRDIKNDEAKLQALTQLFQANNTFTINEIEQKLIKNQLQTGGFSWFAGGKENTYISIRMLEVLGKSLSLDHTSINQNIQTLAKKLIHYLDNDTTLFMPNERNQPVLDYLYARHYWNGLYPIEKDKLEKLQNVLQKSSLTTAKQAAGIAAKSWVVNQIFGIGKTSDEIKNRITQEAILDKEKGMYWESNSTYYNDISMQSYLVEAYKFHNPSKLHAITQWIYYKKQANHWYTTWMTVDAIYASLKANNPQDFVVDNNVKVWINDTATTQNKVVLGQFSKALIKKELDTNKLVKIENSNSRNIYGNIVHQYFSKLEDIKKSTEGIAIRKQYLVERNGQWVTSSEAKLGERIKVKITIVNDRDLQYMHLKDARPSGVEPIFQPSGYSWWKGYYFSINDASTNYFYDHLKQGLTELEYEVKANNIGEFNSGITTIECMYEPSVNARSQNMILKIVPLNIQIPTK